MPLKGAERICTTRVWISPEKLYYLEFYFELLINSLPYLSSRIFRLIYDPSWLPNMNFFIQSRYILINYYLLGTFSVNLSQNQSNK